MKPGFQQVNKLTKREKPTHFENFYFFNVVQLVIVEMYMGPTPERFLIRVGRV
jgi:hypothetical protein